MVNRRSMELHNLPSGIPGKSLTRSKAPGKFFPVGIDGGPLYAVSGTGALITDVDGNKYIDMLCGLGAISLGYRPVNDPFAERLRIRSSGEDAFTVPRIEAQAAGCIEPCSKLKQKQISVNSRQGDTNCRHFFGFGRGRFLAETILFVLMIRLPLPLAGSGTCAKSIAAAINASTSGCAKYLADAKRTKRTCFPDPNSSFFGSGNCGP